jgi:predicted alpha/beta-hydrolase family hydrolase
MSAISRAIELAGHSIVAVGLDSRETDDAVHEQRFRAALASVSGPVIIGGFSLGGRIAAKLCAELEPLALLGFGYPFHAPGRPRVRHGLDVLSRVRVPTRIIQGTRDSHGSEADVRGYTLPDSVELVWLRDGNHRFVPRGRSGLTYDQHVEAATAAAISFIHHPRAMSAAPGIVA